MIRRLAEAVLAACALFALLSGPAAAEIPAGPRLAVVKLDSRLRSELFTAGPLGSAAAVVYAVDAKQLPAIYPSSPLGWSPSGNQIAFTAILGEENRHFSSFPKTAIALVPTEGGEPTLVPGTAGGFDPIFSPDGSRIAFAKERRKLKPNKHGGANLVYDSVSIWLADLSTGNVVQLTPWRNGLQQSPSSFTPDGARLAFTRFAGRQKPKAMSVGLNGLDAEVLATDAIEPVYSPDGSRIAFLRGPTKVKTRRRHHESDVTITVARLTDIYVDGVGVGEPQRLTHTPNAAELGISWDPSGQRIAYTQLKPFSSELAILGFGDAVREVNADGSCDTKVFSGSKEAFFGASWQPGPGRGAGPISC
ncbi:MAG: TolB family protein [Solirubrobacterales bacterium]